MTAAVITVVAIILFISLSFHSAATSQQHAKPIAVSQDISETASTSPTGNILTTRNMKLGGKPGAARNKQVKAKTISKMTQKNTTTATTTTTNLPQQKLSTLINNPPTRNPTNTMRTDKIPLTLPTINQPQSEFVLAMNPRIPANLDLDCSSCAVVTNSADLRNSNAGSVIDSNDCVIRLNTAPTAGYEVDVGAKTTVRVVSQHHLGDLLHHVWHAPEEISSLSYVITFGRNNALCQNCTFFKLFKKVSGEYLGDKFIRLTKALEKNVKTGSRKIRRMKKR
jgi:hypothetical protein